MDSQIAAIRQELDNQIQSDLYNLLQKYLKSHQTDQTLTKRTLLQQTATLREECSFFLDKLALLKARGRQSKILQQHLKNTENTQQKSLDQLI